MVKLGKTGDYPNGKLNDNDEGALILSLFIKNGTIILDFGTKMSWLAVKKEDAYKLGNALIESAKELEGRDKDETVGLE